MNFAFLFNRNSSYRKCGVRYFKTAELFSSIVVERFSILTSNSTIRIGRTFCGGFSFVIGRMTVERLLLFSDDDDGDDCFVEFISVFCGCWTLTKA